ncbi:hypothetical protein BGZ98_008425 [Dissophora globulifera]|nr:hypothetical protein BGZ98_008425 [Dissophora globulifera]
MITPAAMVASDSFPKYDKNEPVAISAATSLAIDIPAAALASLGNSLSMSLPSLLSTSASSSSAYDSLDEDDNVLPPTVLAPAIAGADVRTRRLSQDFFFPNQKKFESATPVVIKARDLHLKDHPIVEGAYAEYEALYNADSLMTKDGRFMVRLL